MSRLQQQAIVIGDSFNNTLGLIRSLGEAKVDIVLLMWVTIVCLFQKVDI